MLRRSEDGARVLVLNLAAKTAAVCGGLAILLGAAVLVGWAIDRRFSFKSLPRFLPLSATRPSSLALSGLALLGIVMNRARLMFIASGIVATVPALRYLNTCFMSTSESTSCWA